ncbi:MAG: TSUP family transporter, partial [Betaproteobacteria bacterium]
MALPLITDPFFYLVAIPSVLLMGVSKSGFGTGFGSLAVPLMALAVSVPEAAAILMPVLLLTDILGLIFLRSHLDWTLLRFLVPCGLVGTVL